mmetsp:Transcript_70621/g.196464  ORF Transcript_70621/g.196464 Transcript_70621/m.196464 type:complete len:594 (-) Transcript_70621:64-1845(-)|eukprot:CAMPEP_0117459634 /NCGR_PEP_ID=MMETSP0784-20121206/1583_1 /TAXON_ID=39447 /ORGANISM="" /LENGTH=593 /DNA_ID=CAMNT_0005253261 /DNA_START=56 /DNA_END=1837 /DNA_ORIENTATION=-
MESSLPLSAALVTLRGKSNQSVSNCSSPTRHAPYPLCCLLLDGKTHYAFVSPGSPQYLFVPGHVNTYGGPPKENIQKRLLSPNLLHIDGEIPIYYTASKQKRYMICYKTFRVVNHLQDGPGFNDKHLHEKCRGAAHYLAVTDQKFFLICSKRDGSDTLYRGARTSCLQAAADWEEFSLPPHLCCEGGVLCMFPTGDADKHEIMIIRDGRTSLYDCDDRLASVSNQPKKSHNLKDYLIADLVHIRRQKILTHDPLPFAAGVGPAQLEYALTALCKIQDIDGNLFSRALKIPAGEYSKEQLLAKLDEIGPRLLDEQNENDPVESLLGGLVGMDSLKNDLRSLRHSLKLDQCRKQQNLPTSGHLHPHVIITGNPGTGKTTVARILAIMLHELGITRSSRVIEVQRGDLVAEYIGQTARKTRRKISEAKGGIIFIDEAYQLAGRGKTDFGAEAIEDIMKDMLCGDPVVVIAGYRVGTQNFLDMNPGLRRHFAKSFHCPDYTVQELAAIFQATVGSKGWALDRGATLEAISAVIEEATSPDYRSMRNGSLAERLFEEAVDMVNSRLVPGPGINYEDACVISLQDVKRGAQKLSLNDQL